MNTSDWKKALKFATESAAIVLKGAYNPDHDILFAGFCAVEDAFYGNQSAVDELKGKFENLVAQYDLICEASCIENARDGGHAEDEADYWHVALGTAQAYIDGFYVI